MAEEADWVATAAVEEVVAGGWVEEAGEETGIPPEAGEAAMRRPKGTAVVYLREGEETKEVARGRRLGCSYRSGSQRWQQGRLLR